jgi:hypothetical protein
LPKTSRQRAFQPSRARRWWPRRCF